MKSYETSLNMKKLSFFVYTIRASKKEIKCLTSINSFSLKKAFKYVNCPPYFAHIHVVKSELLYLPGKGLLNMFNVKKNTNNIAKEKIKYIGNNCANKSRHYPPANKEWFNSVYAYYNNTIKVLPSHDKVISKLMKSYFNIYSRKLENKVRSSRLGMRARKLSTNRMLISKAELKHTADKVIVTIYVFNQQKEFYLYKLKQMDTMDQINKSTFKKIIKDIRGNNLRVASKVNDQKNKFFISLYRDSKAVTFFEKKKKNINYIDSFKSHDKKYLRDYAFKALHKEIFSVFYKQLIFFNKSKFDKRYLLPITSLVNRVYNKKVEFNFVDLKYLYLNSHIFSETLVTKLRNRANKLLRVLKTSLLMFSLPHVDGLAIYSEIYNRKMRAQNLKIQDIANSPLNLEAEADTLEQSLLRLYSVDLIELNDYNYTLNNIFNSIKHKFVSGIRLEVAGRLTKRNTAARSVHKLKYKGSIKNMDSSDKGLSTVMLRGHARSNLQYTFSKSKVRIGSFGLKG